MSSRARTQRSTVKSEMPCRHCWLMRSARESRRRWHDFGRFDLLFPTPPYPGFSWRMTHHMGRVTPEHLYQILWAANRFARNADPTADINNYLVSSFNN